MTRRSTFFALLFLGTLLTSCHKFDGLSVPSYIHIESIELNCDYYTYGANTSNFTSAWVYIDDDLIGCYELPSTFPILKKGPHNVKVYAAININGIGATRSPFPFCKPYVIENLNLVQDSVIDLTPIDPVTHKRTPLLVEYYPVGAGWNWDWNEDFESTCTLKPTPDSDTSVMRISGNEALLSEYSFYSGKIVLPPDSLDFSVTGEEMRFQSDLADGYCMLEMDYNTNDTIFVGVMYYKDYTLQPYPLVKVLPTDTENPIPQNWKKIYINLSRVMKDNVSASYFKVYITSDLSLDPTYGQPDYVHPDKWRYYYFDNLKVLWRP